MTLIQFITEFWSYILAFTIALIAGIYLILFINKHGLKGLSFIGNEVEEIGKIEGGADRPDDCITVYKLINNKSKQISWHLNVITKSRKFHGMGRMAGEIPLDLDQDEIYAIISTFRKHRS